MTPLPWAPEGLVEEVRLEGMRAEVDLIPTFSGCPALALTDLQGIQAPVVKVADGHRARQVPDPILREKFWEQFRVMRDAGRTLLVTTQYVGEAAYCDYVAVLATPTESLAIGGAVVLVGLALARQGDRTEKVARWPDDGPGPLENRRLAQRDRREPLRLGEPGVLHQDEHLEAAVVDQAVDRPRREPHEGTWLQRHLVVGRRGERLDPARPGHDVVGLGARGVEVRRAASTGFGNRSMSRKTS